MTAASREPRVRGKQVLLELARAGLEDLLECLENDVQPARGRMRRGCLAVARAARRRLETRLA